MPIVIGGLAFWIIVYALFAYGGHKIRTRRIQEARKRGPA